MLSFIVQSFLDSHIVEADMVVETPGSWKGEVHVLQAVEERDQ